MNPLVSIIIPTFNRSHILGETLDSVITQAYTSWECIVVDDGSTDYTNELTEFYCEKDSRMKYITRNFLPKGASHCRNIGLDLAKGRYVIFLDSDDILLQNCLKNRVKIVNRYPNKDFFVFPFLIKNYKTVLKPQLPQEESSLRDFISYRIPWQTMCTFWDISFLKGLQGFNVSYQRLNDPEIHIRALLRSESNFKIMGSSDPDCVYNSIESKDYDHFALKYHNSLMLFIPDISKELEYFNKSNYIYLLRGYLKDYLKKSYAHMRYVDNLKLLKVFYSSKVFTLKEFIIIYSQFQVYFILKKLLKRSRRTIDKILELT